MLLNAFQHSFSVDQQQKIMRQIQVINKKLNSNPYSVKHPDPQLLQQNKSNDKYFSQQCDELFNDDNYPITIRNQASFEDSLFCDKSSLLLGNQYEKEIKNFKEFETDKYSSQNIDKPAFGRDIRQCVARNLEPKIKDTRFAKKQQPSQNQTDRYSIKSQSNTQSQSTLTLLTKTSKSRIKSIAESKIKKYIQNKENILPASNMQQRQKSYIKQVRKKIRFQTQPDCFQQKEDSLEDQQNGHLGEFVYGHSRSRTKYDSSRNALECTFKPNILKKSSEIAENMQPSFERLTQDITGSKSQSKLPYKARLQLSTKKYSVKRLQQLSQPRKLKTLAEDEEPKYDFRPSLSKKSLQQMANCTMDVASRNKLWLQQRQAKVTRLKEEQEQKKLKQQMGSYAPKITPYKGDRQVNLSRYAKDGISSYFQRVSMAKQKQQTLEKKRPQPKEEMKESNINMKKKTYDEAVRELHKKIMAFNL